ncbi:sigma-70 family RNA polymerase sigma factor [Pigmentiphaga sp. D-2]|jgi:RNA polymerase sigma-70 factor (ECF subfamily)|uniref:sigma-70 family RNA polymerase sigma factor n=1 Tax=Pigmentiphaga sp. D-2 TaxID=1002116 RepID=UPI0010525514|nr:sigma-70 family RNA polymerase sigma factor [Pigmentiphaga sp. D-2]
MSEPRADPDLNHLRPRLIRLAYRMLGSVAEAEDVVQDAYVRWLATDSDKVRQPAALLHTIVTRLCLNELKSARRRRETYVGPWLPEPIVETREAYADDLTLPLMLALERLSPLERAAFLLHDVFGMDFAEVGAAIGREAAACRKLASRAREHVHAARPRFPVSKEQGSRLAAAFFAASRHGDMEGLRALLAEDVTAYADGGGKVPATPYPVVGVEAVLARHARLAGDFARAPSILAGYVEIDGLPGFVTMEDGGVLQATALQVEEGKVTAIYVIRNPDKLRHLRAGPGTWREP